MTRFLIRRFIRNPEDTADSGVRLAYGRLAGAAGLTANLLLFILKLTAGLLAGSLAVMADAFNNLSDAGSSIVTLVGFKLSAAPPDEEHPFGHGRMEYLSTLVVAALIIVAGFELATASFDKILHPTLPAFGLVQVVVLIAAIGVKLWMALFYKKVGTLIHSDTLKAACADSRNDVICTGVVLVSSIVGWGSGLAVDGYVGAAVALFVMWSGVSIMKDTISPLLGQAPSPELVRSIRETVLAHDGVVGIHDLMIHNYGPGRCVISLHAEVPCREDLLRSHDRIDCIEKELMKEYHAIVCIHMDPVDTEDERVETLKVLIKTILGDIDPRMDMHDFRVVFGETHTNVIFDLVVPFEVHESKALCDEIQRRVQTVDPRLCVVATVEHSFT